MQKIIYIGTIFYFHLHRSSS